MALEGNARCLPQPTPAPLQRNHGRHAGILLRVPGAVRRDRELDQTKTDLRRLDNRKLVARHLSHFPGQRTPLRANPVPDFYFGRFRRAESFLAWNDDNSIASFSRSFRRTFRPRLVGFLRPHIAAHSPNSIAGAAR